MYAIAEHLGFTGGAEKWAEEFRGVCAGRGPPDVGRFQALLNDLGESGWYCSDEELRRLLREVAEHGPRLARPPAPAPAAPAPAAPAPSAQAPTESRAELVRRVFLALQKSASPDVAGRLGEAEMRRFAAFTGFEGSAEEWSEEFALICSESGGGSTLDLAHFRRLVDDEGDSGCYCADGELRQCLSELCAEAAVR